MLTCCVGTFALHEDRGGIDSGSESSAAHPDHAPAIVLAITVEAVTKGNTVVHERNEVLGFAEGVGVTLSAWWTAFFGATPTPADPAVR